MTHSFPTRAASVLADGAVVSAGRQGASQSVDRHRLVAAPSVARNDRHQPDQARRPVGDLGADRLRLCDDALLLGRQLRSEEHTSELQSLMRISYAVFCLKKKTQYNKTNITVKHSTQSNNIQPKSTAANTKKITHHYTDD